MSRYSPNYGVWIMNADGTGKELVDEGWSIEWCPKGNRVAYTTYRDGANILVRDLGKGEGRTLLDKEYRQIYWGMAWSPDGQWIAFKGITPDGKAELAAVHVEGQSKGFKILLPKAMPDVKDILWASSWGGDGKRLIASLVGPKGGPRQLYFLDFAEKEPPQLVPGQDPTWANSEMAWSADGKKLAFRAMPPSRRLPSRSPVAVRVCSNTPSPFGRGSVEAISGQLHRRVSRNNRHNCVNRTSLTGQSNRMPTVFSSV